MSTLLVSVNFNGNIGAVQAYNTTTGRLLSQQRLSGIPTGLAVSRNGLFVGNASDRFSIITRIAQNQARAFADPPIGTTDLAIGFNGNLFSLSRQGFIQEFDGRTGAFIRPLAIGTTLTTGITFGPDGAIYASTVRGNIEKVDPRTGRILDTVGFLLPGPRDLAFNRAGQLFVLTARNGNSVEIIGGPRGPIFPPLVRQIVLFTPFPYMIGFPASILVGLPVNIGLGLLVMIGWILLFLVLNRWFWKRGLRQYSGMGA
ncbi:ABC-2 family transporter protein [Leptolyngbya sp. 7M]|uniref:ABC-2 family transporter protein n=1 Tax=Leptolyngbya sp. 7M TaxID=2812896 RepID=UPI001B8D1D6F|nr:ABC-2 family transporter protein [Leptolyngbya sp. 7M]QYO64022.1 ABC-2 family transporter protein [Leptolyngbya sp. 7M]